MAIKSKDEMPARPIEIDLTGPDGNAFVLIGLARKLWKQLHKEEEDAVKEVMTDLLGEKNPPKLIDTIIEEMMSGDYENLIKVFDREFGKYVTLYR